MNPLMPDFSTMLPDEVLVWVHVPEADTLTHEDAVKLANERNQQGARELEADVSQLHIKEAAQVAREAQFEFLNDQDLRVKAEHKLHPLPGETREEFALRELGY